MAGREIAPAPVGDGTRPVPFGDCTRPVRKRHPPPGSKTAAPARLENDLLTTPMLTIKEKTIRFFLKSTNRV